MKTFGPLYGGKLRWWHKKPWPLIEKGTTYETEMPFRIGHSLVVRVPFTEHAYYAGLLFKSVEDPHLLTDEDIDLIMARAMKGRKAWTPDDGAYDEFFE